MIGFNVPLTHYRSFWRRFYGQMSSVKKATNRNILLLCPEKVVHQTHSNNSVDSKRIFKIISLLDSQVYFKQNPYNTFHHTFSMLLHYLAKLKSSSFGIWHIWKKMQTKTEHILIFEHTPNFNALNLLTYLFVLISSSC